MERNEDAVGRSQRNRREWEGSRSVSRICGVDVQGDLAFRNHETGLDVGPMARPVRLKWANHDWRPTTTAPTLRRPNSKEDRIDRSTYWSVGKVASADSAAGQNPVGGIARRTFIVLHIRTHS